jgi:hypothetical protein
MRGRTSYNDHGQRKVVCRELLPLTPLILVGHVAKVILPEDDKHATLARVRLRRGLFRWLQSAINNFYDSFKQL